MDHVFLSKHSFDALKSCEVLTDSSGPNTDHLLILTKVDLAIAKALVKSTTNFRNIEWDKFKRTLREKLETLGDPRAIRSQGELDTECSRLTEALQNTIKAEVPSTEISPKSKHW